MTAKEAHALVTVVYPQAFEDRVRKGWHVVRGGPINRASIGYGETSAKAWKDAATRLAPRHPVAAE